MFREVVIGPCRLINADCMDVLPTLERVDAVVTDPPYGIGADTHEGPSSSGWTQWDKTEWDSKPSRETFDAILRFQKPTVVWGGNYFTDVFPPTMQWLVWDKGQRDFSLADCEFAWSSNDRASRIYTYARGKALKDGRVHPTQKPIAVMEWTVGFVPTGVVLDPFMGSGTTGIACINTSRKFIGIEREPKYFDIACKRIQQAWDLKCSELPFEKPEPAKQLAMFGDDEPHN